MKSGHTAVLTVSCLLSVGCMFTGISRKSIDRAEARWNAQQITNYQYDVHLDAFLPRSPCLNESGVLTVVVRDSKTVSYGTCIEVPAREADQASIEALFKMAKELRSDDIASLRMTFDPDLGYPRKIEVVTSRFTTDSSFTFTVSNFK